MYVERLTTSYIDDALIHIFIKMNKLYFIIDVLTVAKKSTKANVTFTIFLFSVFNKNVDF